MQTSLIVTINQKSKNSLNSYSISWAWVYIRVATVCCTIAKWKCFSSIIDNHKTFFTWRKITIWQMTIQIWLWTFSKKTPPKINWNNSWLTTCIMQKNVSGVQLFPSIPWMITTHGVVRQMPILCNYRKFPKYSDTQNICCNHSKIWTKWLYYSVMSPNDTDRMTNSVDPDQTSSRSSLIWVCTVCPGISVRKLRIITVA